jgi:hypothetical protein
MIQPLSPDLLRRHIDPASLGDAKSPGDGIIGQQRALNALEFGLGMRDSGFNVYVAGEPGIGKMIAVRTFLSEQAAHLSAPAAWCYVNNFVDPSQPLTLTLPAGRARTFQRDVQTLVDRISREIPKAFESEEYLAQREAIGKALDEQRNDLLGNLRSQAHAHGVMLQMTPYSIVTLPLRDGEPIPEHVFQQLPAAEQELLRKRNDGFQEQVRVAMKSGRELDRTAQEKVTALNKKVAQFVVNGLVEDLSGAPLQQGIAVTGSVNQHGQVQAIGGVNEKIEGFFDVCRARGLSGTQGALIPASNVQNLMLRPDVIDAVRTNQFRIWAIHTIDEGIEILTGIAAGERNQRAKFPRDTINARVDARLQQLTTQLQRLGDEKKR